MGEIGQFPVTGKVVEKPALVGQLDEETNTKVLVELLTALLPVAAQYVRYAVAREMSAISRSGDKVLTLKEVSERLRRSPQSISLGWRKGRYPFMLKDGAHLVASQDGLDRWIKARARA